MRISRAPRGRAPGAPRPRALQFEIARAAVSAIRQIRAEYNVTPGKMVEVVAIGRDASARAVLAEESALIGRLARATISTSDATPSGAAAHALLPDGSEVVVLLAGLVDLDKECARVSTELAQLEKQLGALEQRLANESFTSRAKPEVVEAERTKLGEWSDATRAARKQEEDAVRQLIPLLALGALIACAQQGFPPGGPPDKEPPKLLKTTPDSNARNVSEKEVDFQFDEVLSERPAGASCTRRARADLSARRRAARGLASLAHLGARPQGLEAQHDLRDHAPAGHLRSARQCGQARSRAHFLDGSRDRGIVDHRNGVRLARRTPCAECDRRGGVASGQYRRTSHAPIPSGASH